MAIYLITGKPGSFKTAYFMSQAIELLESGRLVYFCNVRGLEQEKYDLNTIEHINEWQDLPHGTAVFVDEIQEFTRDVPTNCKTEDLPDWVKALEKHRHLGYDFYFTTQHPMFVHTHFRRLIEKHIHMNRVEGMPFSNMRQWSEICNEPENRLNASIKMGCTTSVYRPNKKAFEYYESTVQDTHKFRINPKLIKYLILIFIGIAISLYFALPFIKKYINISQNTSDNVEVVENKILDENQTSSLIMEQCIKPENMHNQECIDFFNHSQSSSPIQTLADDYTISYDIRNPYYSEEQIDYQYTINEVPVLAGCSIFDNKCSCYTQQMTVIPMLESDCKRYMNGDKPFNPFLVKKESKDVSISPKIEDNLFDKKTNQTYAITNTSDNAFVQDENRH